MAPHKIEIDWKGPFTLNEVEQFNDGGESPDGDGKDYGLYQIYGKHLLCGENTLLYIGVTLGSTFSVRFREHRQNWLDDDQDEKDVTIYLGRVYDPQKHSENDNWHSWKNDIKLAEKILIFKYSPNYNGRELSGKPDLSPHTEVQLINSGDANKLKPTDNGSGMKQRLYRHVDFMTSVSPPRNYNNTESLEKVADYIFSEFSKLECQVDNQYFTVQGKDYRNIIASFNADNEERLVVGAHYDVCGDQPGADDNASTVAGLLETARMLSIEKPEINYRIDFVAYCLEEPPFFATQEMGSAFHARHLHDNNIPVKGMICYEMIGYFTEDPDSQQFPDPELSNIYPTTGNFIIVVGKQGQEPFIERIKKYMKENSLINVQSIGFPEAGTEGLAGFSDHRNYWMYGYNAVMINDTAFMRNPHYHETSDKIETLDFDKMSEVVKGSYAAIINL